MTKPIRGGLGIVIVLLLIGGASVLSFAPGGWGALPIVKYFVKYFESLTAFDIGASLSAILVLVVTILAALDARSRRAKAGSEVPRRFNWTGPRFVASLVLTPTLVIAGYWFLRGSEGFLVGPAWGYAYLTVAILVGGFWLASAFHAFLSLRRTLLWIIGGMAIFASVSAVRVLVQHLEPFAELTRIRSRDGIEYLSLGKCTSHGKFENRFTTKIARVQSAWLGLTWYEDLLQADSKSTCTGLYPEFGRLVRPEGFTSDYRGDLFVSVDGFVASVWGDMYCDLAYDTRNRIGYGEWHDRTDKRYGRGMESLSPFRLLEAGGQPAACDVGHLEAEAAEQAKHYATRPPAEWPDDRKYLLFAIQEAPLLAALESRNELVRVAARRIIRAGGKALYPEAFDRVR